MLDQKRVGRNYEAYTVNPSKLLQFQMLPKQRSEHIPWFYTLVIHPKKQSKNIDFTMSRWNASANISRKSSSTNIKIYISNPKKGKKINM